MRKLIVILISASVFSVIFGITLSEYILSSGQPSYELTTSTNSIVGGKLFILDMKSQIWRGIEWNHKVVIYVPKKLLYKSEAILFVSGSAPKNIIGEANKYLGIAELVGALLIILFDIPNQPLFGLREDALIAYTFAKYFETQEEDWPLLLPMVKSVISTMDCTQDFLKSQGIKIEKFLVTGASKRGWTTYLTGAVDNRVLGIVPIVYDNLNMREQMKKQLEYYGTFSEQIRDYTKYGFTEMVAKSEEVPELVKLVDPYYYEINVPKLIIAGTNDPYWVVDSSELYFYDLSEPKYVRFIPNDVHNLKNTMEVFSAIRTFFILCVERKLPDFSWEMLNDGIKIFVHDEVEYVKGWYATSEILDFRKSKWENVDLEFHNQDGITTSFFSKSLINSTNTNIAMLVEVRIVKGDYVITLTTIPKVYKKAK
ncbi:MAG TPA: PhoPQ-activated protein PqaA family protein [Fervidobacterium nodosum]|nr:PhoPQ-activated protein PqaA family protein [Fervidobacterium nodosum]